MREASWRMRAGSLKREMLIIRLSFMHLQHGEYDDCSRRVLIQNKPTHLYPKVVLSDRYEGMGS
jgi:hypothetical protein